VSAVGCPAHPAESIDLLHAGSAGYWWDHTALTVAVQAHPGADPTLINAAREAICYWNTVLQGDPDLHVITVTDVTDTLHPAKQADITLHYVPHAGGVVFDGYAICGKQTCNNILISSDAPHGDPSSPEYLGWVTLHELGHALGLGHAAPLDETNDLMGYGWPSLGPAVLSPCDRLGLQTVFAWAINGESPTPPTASSVDCRGLCPGSASS
jgi:hypothetical protein